MELTEVSCEVSKGSPICGKKVEGGKFRLPSINHTKDNQSWNHT